VMCHKHDYPSYTMAMRDAKRLKKYGSMLYTVYKCQECATWHVGSTPHEMIRHAKSHKPHGRREYVSI